jgi:uncharacterized damage-inducible protein DinB
MTIAETLLPEFDQEMASTRKLLACVPNNILSYKPHQKSMVLGRLAGHVAELPSWALHTIEHDSLDITPAPGKGFEAFVAKNNEDLLQTFDRNVADARKAIAGASDAHLIKPWKLIYKGQTIVDMPRATVLRTSVLNHLIHHRAQLGVYLRLNNVAIPGMYGPSADDFNPFAQQQTA